MDTKLTIRLNTEVIDKAKKYALVNNISLSKMIESYLKSVTKEYKNEPEVTPLVESLSGVISLPEDFDHKKEYEGFLENKYK